MDYNIISRYTKFLIREYLNFFRLIFSNNYPKEICTSFLERYISVRYYNETNYRREKDFIERLNKELIALYKTYKTEENEETLKNIVALFGYIIYFDDIDAFVYEADLINTLIEDETIKIFSKKTAKEDILKWYINFKKTKEKFNSSVLSKEFTLSESRIYRNTFKLDLLQSVKISNLYSEFAINKAYNMGTVYEQRIFITYILSSYLLLEKARNLDFSKHYIVDFATSLFDKEKKLKRLLNIFDNPLTKKFITIRLTYEDYLEHQDIVNNYISQGYSFGVILDSKFNGDIENLILFSYIFMHENYELYDEIMENKDNIKSKIITL